MLAHHYHQALELSRAAGGELDALIPAARSALAQASERAETLHAWPAARELAASALDLTEAGDPARPVLAVRMTRAEMNLSDFDPDRAAAARELCLEQGDFEHGAEAESLRGLMLWQRGAREAALAAYERSVELVAGLPDSPSKLHVLAARARLAAIMHDLETALRLVEEALGPAERLGRDDYLSSLLNTRGRARANAGQPGGVEDLRRAVEVAERSQEAWSLLQAHNNLAQLLWQTGRIEEGAEQLAAYDRTVERFGMQFQLGWLDAQKVYLAYLRGEYGEMIDGAERYLSAYADTSTYMEAPQRAILAHAYAVLGRTDAALAFSERGLELSLESQGPEGRGFALLARAHALWSAGRGSEASVTVEELLTDSPALTHLHWLAPLPLLLHEHGLGAECVRILDAAPMPSLWRDALALLADGRFLEAAEVYERIGSRLVWAWTLLLATEHGQVDPRNLGEARQCFRTLDAAPFLRRIDQLNVASA
jgi:tetratricopeptide (TPR) repeat protein